MSLVSPIAGDACDWPLGSFFARLGLECNSRGSATPILEMDGCVVAHDVPAVGFPSASCKARENQRWRSLSSLAQVNSTEAKALNINTPGRFDSVEWRDVKVGM